MNTRSLCLRGLQTAWLEGGLSSINAPILFLLHGFPDTPTTWEYQFAHFEKDFQIVAPYARGVGPSESAADLERYAESSTTLDLLQILQEVDPTGKRDVYLVGHDLGVVAAWNLAPLLGERLKAMVVVNGLSLVQMFARRGRIRQHLKSWYIYVFQIPRLPEFLARRFPKPCLAVAHTLGGLPKDRRPTGDEPFYGSVAHYRAFAREFPWLGSREPVKIAAPVLVLWGSEDRFLLPPTWDELTPFTSRPVSRVIPGNHWIHRERAAEVNEAMDRFFAEGVR